MAMPTNVKHEIKGDKLIITVDVSKDTLTKAQPSSTGKNKLVASTRGTLQLTDNLSVGLNVMYR